MKTTVWLSGTYLNRWEDTQRIQNAIVATYGVSCHYFLGSWIGGDRIHYVELDGVTKTQAQSIASTIKAFHLAEILSDSYKPEWQKRVLIEGFKLEVSPDKPEWAEVIYQ